MAEETIVIRSDRYGNKNVSELQQANRSPIDGYEDQEIMPLENAVEKIVPFVRDIVKYADSAKQECNRISDRLTWDESAAIYLYTMPINFYSCLNKTLRAEDRSALKPWFAFLKLFMSALQKLPSSKTTVWRAVADDMSSFPNVNNEIIWWGVNSTSTALNVVQAFLSETGTLFAIETIHGKNISEYSAFPVEEEVLLMPGTRVRVKSKSINFIGRFSIVHLEEKLTVEQNPKVSMCERFSEM
jgi:hypothetical protein